MDAGVSPASVETPRKNVNKEGICLLCSKQVDPKRRIKIFKHGEETNVSKILRTFLGDDVFLGSVVCNGCLTKAKNFEQFQSEMKESVNNIKLTTRTKRLISESPKVAHKTHCQRTPFKDQANTPEIRKMLFKVEPKSETKSKPTIVHKVHSSTQTDDIEEEGLSVIITYQTGRRVYRVPPDRQDIVKQAALGSDESVTKAILANEKQRQTTIEAIGDMIHDEMRNYASKSDPSVLRDNSNSCLKSFTWKQFEAELLQRAPILSSVLMCAQNQRQQRTKQLMPGTLHVASSMLSLFCQDLNLVKKIVSIAIKRGGAKKRLFKTLSQLNLCVSYRTTARLFQSFGRDFDTNLVSWKKAVEEDVATEKRLQDQISSVTTEVEKGTLTAELNSHRDGMHPGYQFVGDNVDFIVKVRHMSSKHQNKDHHLFQCVSYKNRLAGYHLEDTKQFDTNFSLSSLLPTISDNQKLVDDFTHLTLKVWTEQITALKFMSEHIEPYIKHPYMAQTRKTTEKVRLGVLQKNENKIDDMVDICQFLHQYVPGHSTETENMPTKCLSGGDYLTYERHKKAQSTMQDSRTPSERLEGLQAKFEEFHTQAEVNKVVLKPFLLNPLTQK